MHVRNQSSYALRHREKFPASTARRAHACDYHKRQAASHLKQSARKTPHAPATKMPTGSPLTGIHHRKRVSSASRRRKPARYIAASGWNWTKLTGTSTAVKKAAQKSLSYRRGSVQLTSQYAMSPIASTITACAITIKNAVFLETHWREFSTF